MPFQQLQQQRRETCDACHHRHADTSPCHVFVQDKQSAQKRRVLWESAAAKPASGTVEAGELSDEEHKGSDDGGGTDASSESDGGSSSSGGSSDGGEGEATASGGQTLTAILKGGKDVLRLGASVVKKAGKLAKVAAGKRQADIKTEPWAASACLKRCNCAVGVPSNHAGYVPVPAERTITTADLQTIIVRYGPPTAQLPGHNNATAAPEAEARAWAAFAQVPLFALRTSLEFLDARDTARSARVGRDWHRECYAADPSSETVTSLHANYVAMHRTGASEVAYFVGHQKRIEAMIVSNPKARSSGYLLAAGGKAVSAWVAEEESGGGSWQRRCTVMEDTAPLTLILPGLEGSFYCFSTNGSIKVYSLPFEPRPSDFRVQLWEHSAQINGAVLVRARESVNCGPHDVLNCSCAYLYTVSDDRTARVWDMAAVTCLAVLEPRPARCGTLLSVAVSSYHLYLGGSGGEIFVYPLRCVCERTDRHSCHLRGEALPYCLQETLHHGQRAVVAVACARRTLFTGSRDGSVMAWRIPRNSFGHRPRLTLLPPAQSPVACITSVADRHVWVARGREVQLWDVGTLRLQRAIKARQCVRSVCVHVRGGLALLGLSDGRIQAFTCGGFLP